MISINKRKKLSTLILVTTIIITLAGGIYSFAQPESDEEKLIEEQKSTSEVKELEEHLKKYDSRDLNELLPGYDPKSILEEAGKGNFQFDLKGILNRALMFIFKEVYQNLHILIKLVILVVLCAVLKNLQSSFLSQSVGELAFYVCYIVIVSILIVSFSTVLTIGREIIDNMVTFMQASVPVLITLLMSGGNFASGGVFQPVLVMVVQVAATVMKNIFIPLIFLSTILSILDNISEKVQISKLAGFFKQLCGWSLGIILTVFIAVVSLQGSLGAVIDGVTSKTAKFAIGTFIPIAGKYLADAADTVIGCTLVIKNAAGIAAMVGVISICIIPLLKILALILLYRFTGAIIEPISESRITNCIGQITSSITYIFGISVSVAFMFLLSITVIIGASNISAAIR
ncbi:MAG: stage III sporulation protein AE [Clostridia bacterium]|nr:stage III sporulation protein AE [Clostridia bacterium]